MSRFLIIFSLAVAAGIPALADASSVPTADEIVKRLALADAARLRAFQGYAGMRLYTIENTRFHVRARMKVEVTVDSSGKKAFRVLETSGPGAVRKMVFEKMLETETKASTPSEQAATRISGDNYAFEVAGVGEHDGRSCFILNANPKTSNPLLFRGQIWVDSTEYAVVRIQGSPAKNPSFWVRKTEFEHRYQKEGSLWLASSNRSASDVRVFGTTNVSIDYVEYRLPPQSASAGARAN